MTETLLSRVPPVRFLVLAMSVPAVSVPLVASLRMRNGYLGEMEMSVLGGPFHPLDPRWFLPILGALALFGYALLASVALILTRHKSSRYRNVVTLALVPVYLAGIWLVVVTKS